MRSGPLRDRVTIYEQRNTRDAGGASLPEFVPVATVWARIDPLSGRERILAGGAGGMMSHRVTLRYFQGLTPRHEMRVTTRNGERRCKITAVVNPDGRLREHVCDVVEAV